MQKKPRGLGRGLSALMADVNQDAEAQAGVGELKSADRTVPVEKLRANPDQPRRRFAQEHWTSLLRLSKKRVFSSP